MLDKAFMVAHPPDLSGRPVRADSEDDFRATYAPLFEHSPWVVMRAWSKRPFRDAAALYEVLLGVLTEAGAEERLALACAHPELADETAIAKGLTESSAREQSAAGLTNLAARDQHDFRSLNRAYREKFGFPFIICARLNDKTSILSAMRHRLTRARDAELDEAMRQVGLIVQFRLAETAEAPA